MKSIIYLFATGMLVLFSSCLTSLQPLVTTENAIADNRITGNWEYDGYSIDIVTLDDKNKLDQPSQQIPGVSLFGSFAEEVGLPVDMKDKTYVIEFKKDSKRYFMSAMLAKLGNEVFLNLTPALIDDPESPEGSMYEYNPDYLPTISFAKLELSKDQMLLHFPDGDYIKEQLLNNKIRIKHESDDLFGNLLITATPAELQQFLQKYSQDKRLFNDNNTITLKRKR